MARIRIDDLPVAEDLTPEQEALLQGAGLKSFRPSLETLETREVPAVISALGADGTLKVTGDETQNKVTVTQEMGTLSDGKTQGLVVKVVGTHVITPMSSIGPHIATYDASKVQEIEFSGLGTRLTPGAQDTFTNRTAIDYYVSTDVVDQTFAGLGQNRQLTSSAQNLTRDEAMVIRVPLRDGGVWTFRPDAQGRYVPDPGTAAILTKIQGVGYKLAEPNGYVTTYDTSGNFTGTETGFFLNSSDLTNGRLPPSSAGQGDNKAPSLKWESPPAGTKSFALTMEDRSAARDGLKGKYTHWVVYNIPAGTRELRVVEGSLRAFDGDGNIISGWKEALPYYGPNPSDGKEHTYVFTLYALKTENLNLPAGATQQGATQQVAPQQQLLTAMHGHIIGQTSLRGLYSK